MSKFRNIGYMMAILGAIALSRPAAAEPANGHWMGRTLASVSRCLTWLLAQCLAGSSRYLARSCWMKQP